MIAQQYESNLPNNADNALAYLIKRTSKRKTNPLEAASPPVLYKDVVMWQSRPTPNHKQPTLV